MIIVRSIAAGIMLFTGLAAAHAQVPVLYTSNPVQAVEEVNAISQRVLGAPLGVITGGSGVLMRRMEAEKSDPQGDIFWSGSQGTVKPYEHLFEAYSAPPLSSIPAELHYPGDIFQPTNVHVVTLFINTSLVDEGVEAPKRWADLADPAWKGKIIVANPNNSSMGFAVAWGLSKALDEKTYKAVVSNIVVTDSSSGVAKGVAMGEYAIGIGFEWGAYSYIAGGQEGLEIVYPSEGTFLNVEYAGIVKNAPSGDAARKGIDLLLSKETQIKLLEVGYRRPSRSDITVSDHVKLPELNTIKTIAINELEAANARTDFLAAWDALPKSAR